MDNHSRYILASALTRIQDLASYLSVLCAAVEEYGSPETLFTGRGEFSEQREVQEGPLGYIGLLVSLDKTKYHF